MSQKDTSFTLKAHPDLSNTSGCATGYRVEMEATRDGNSMPERQRSTTSMTGSLRNGRGLGGPRLYFLL